MPGNKGRQITEKVFVYFLLQFLYLWVLAPEQYHYSIVFNCSNRNHVSYKSAIFLFEFTKEHQSLLNYVSIYDMEIHEQLTKKSMQIIYFMCE